MKNKRIATVGILLLAYILLWGCSGKKSDQEAAALADSPAAEAVADIEDENSSLEEEETESISEQNTALPDGVYTAEFDTDNSMFRVCEACDGKGTLTVENGEMTLHISLGSKNIVNLYPGLAEDAKKDGAILLMPTEDAVTYSDGWVDTVYGFDIPVPVLEKEFDGALIGKKGKWYDHKVVVSNPQPMEEEVSQVVEEKTLAESFIEPAEGSYTVELTFAGGSGKAEILSPAVITITGETTTAIVEWSSPFYDYMIIEEEKYLPINTEGNSVFEIPVTAIDEPMVIIGDTVAMSRPHEIEYTLTFHSDTMKPLE